MFSRRCVNMAFTQNFRRKAQKGLVLHILCCLSTYLVLVCWQIDISFNIMNMDIKAVVPASNYCYLTRLDLSQLKSVVKLVYCIMLLLY